MVERILEILYLKKNLVETFIHSLHTSSVAVVVV